MRYALLADIHGNSVGLDAVLDDIQARGGADSYILLGDYATTGPDPAGVLERISKLPVSVCVSGNADAILGQVPFYESVPANTGWSWTRGCVTQAGWYAWLLSLPLEGRLTLPDGTALLAVHASPGTNSGDGLYPGQTDEAVAALFDRAAETLILVGHTHIPQERRINGKHIVNPGSIGNPLSQDVRACYGFLDAGEQGYAITLYRVAYDIEAVMRAIDAMYFPDPEFLRTFYRGEYIPEWERE